MRLRKNTHKSLFVFDFDGTIADTMEPSIKIMNSMAEEFGYRRIERDELEWLRSRTMWQFIRHLKIPLRKISKILHRAQDEMARNILEVPIIPGMSEVLRELKGLGHQIGIMTSNSKENVDALLQHNDLELFDFKLCSVKLRKKARNLKLLRRQHKVRCRNMLYVGDECRDVRAAKKARVKCAAVTWGFNNAKILRKFRPHFLISEPSDLLAACHAVVPVKVAY